MEVYLRIACETMWKVYLYVYKASDTGRNLEDPADARAATIFMSAGYRAAAARCRSREHYLTFGPFHQYNESLTWIV